MDRRGGLHQNDECHGGRRQHRHQRGCGDKVSQGTGGGKKPSAIAANAAKPRHCHSEWIRAQPSACMTSAESQLSSLAILVFLVRIQDAAEFFDLFG